MRFCSQCGAAVELRQPVGDTLERHVCTGCGEIHYLNPKVVVGAVCRWQDRVLLCRRAIEPRAGFWVVPEDAETGMITYTMTAVDRFGRKASFRPFPDIGSQVYIVE